MRYILSILLITGLLLSAKAQKQASIWHFGDGRCLDFSSGAPVLLPGSQMNTFEGCASYCDQFGNLLFYTNGGGREPAFSGQDPGHIWNKNNAVMYDMQGVEGGGFSASQSSVIFEAPGQDSIYYVFTMDEIEYSVGASPATQAAQPLGRGLSYFTVDMRLNAGLGDVVLADQRLYTPSYEGLCAIRHANGHDYWIIINRDSTGLGIYSVTSAGVAFAAAYNGSGGPANFSIKASPNGGKVMTYFSSPQGASTVPILLDFNNSTGQLSNPVALSVTNFIGSYEFSPNSRFLYTTETNFTSFPTTESIVRYDLFSANISSTATTLGNITNGNAVGLQLAPDGKIYFFAVDYATNTNFINRIKCPNSFGASLELNLFTTVSSSGTFYLSFPNFPAWLFENNDSTYVSLGVDTIDLCNVGGSYVLDAQNQGATYLWSTGDTTQTITVSTPGTYTVTVNGDCGIGTDQVVVTGSGSVYTITASACSSYTAPWGAVFTQSGTYNDTLTSAGGCDSIVSVVLTITGEIIAPTITASACDSYTAPWGTTYTQSGTYFDTLTTVAGCDSIVSLILSISGNVIGPSIIANACDSYSAPWGTIYSQSGLYSDTLTSVNGCDSLLTVNLTINTSPVLTVNTTPDSCSAGVGSAQAVVTGTGNYSYFWSNGGSSPLVSGLSGGNYSVIVTDLNGCSDSASFAITGTAAPIIVASASSLVINPGDSVQLFSSGANSFTWQPAATLSCSDCPSPFAAPTQTTTYVVTGTAANGCTSVAALTITVDIACSELFLPNIFSPDGTGPQENEQLCVLSNCIEQMDLAIYDRWGQIIFQTNDPKQCWNGQKDGKEVMTGVYAFRLFVKQLDGKEIRKSGTVTLVK